MKFTSLSANTRNSLNPEVQRKHKLDVGLQSKSCLTAATNTFHKENFYFEGEKKVFGAASSQPVSSSTSQPLVFTWFQTQVGLKK